MKLFTWNILKYFRPERLWGLSLVHVLQFDQKQEYYFDLWEDRGPARRGPDGLG